MAESAGGCALIRQEVAVADPLGTCDGEAGSEHSHGFAQRHLHTASRQASLLSVSGTQLPIIVWLCLTHVPASPVPVRLPPLPALPWSAGTPPSASGHGPKPGATHRAVAAEGEEDCAGAPWRGDGCECAFGLKKFLPRAVSFVHSSGSAWSEIISDCLL